MIYLFIFLLCFIIIGLIAMLYKSYEEFDNVDQLMKHYREMYHKTEEQLNEYKRGVSRMIFEENLKRRTDDRNQKR